MGRSIGLGLYLMVSNHLTGYANRTLKRRLAAGKEDADRIDERRGIASRERPKGQLIWFHAASVGESLSLLDLISRLRDDDPGLSILITTGTQTSANLLDKRLPPEVIHQYAPVDARPFVQEFLNHWKPDAAVWTESELWPAMIHETHARGVPMVLLNARMSEKSMASWRWARSMVKSLLSRFRVILSQDKQSQQRLLKLGADPEKVTINGSLKQSGGALPYRKNWLPKLCKSHVEQRID
jgi:3-deoxy-D-manno-octulosonic-acid transferase